MGGFHRSCIYQKEKHGYISGCGMRVAYTTNWRYCPFCGLPISNLSNAIKEREEERKHSGR